MWLLVWLLLCLMLDWFGIIRIRIRIGVADGGSDAAWG